MEARPGAVHAAPEWSDSVAGCRMVFHPDRDAVRIDLGGSEAVAIAGHDEAGCRFFLDGDRRLTAVELPIPVAVADFMTEEQVDLANTAIAGSARPGGLRFRDVTAAPLMPAAVWLSSDLRLAVAELVEGAFDRMNGSETDDLWFVLVGAGAVVVVDSTDLCVQGVAAVGFAEHQEVFGLEISVETRGHDVIEALNALHLDYYEAPPPEQFAEAASQRVAALVRADGSLLDSAGNGRPIARLIEAYRYRLEVLAP